LYQPFILYKEKKRRKLIKVLIAIIFTITIDFIVTDYSSQHRPMNSLDNILYQFVNCYEEARLTERTFCFNSSLSHLTSDYLQEQIDTTQLQSYLQDAMYHHLSLTHASQEGQEAMIGIWLSIHSIIEDNSLDLRLSNTKQAILDDHIIKSRIRQSLLQSIASSDLSCDIDTQCIASISNLSGYNLRNILIRIIDPNKDGMIRKRYWDYQESFDIIFSNNDLSVYIIDFDYIQ